MKTIGFRVKPKQITFVVYDSNEHSIINVETIKIPKALSIPEYLKYIRTNIIDILREYQISKAGLRITESSAQSLNIERIQIEGVIQETFASTILAGYFCGQISNISPKLGIERSDFKKYVNGELNYDSVENWSELNEEEREACLTAIGTVNA